jgi:hypothetical protein
VKITRHRLRDFEPQVMIVADLPLVPDMRCHDALAGEAENAIARKDECIGFHLERRGRLQVQQLKPHHGVSAPYERLRARFRASAQSPRAFFLVEPEDLLSRIPAERRMGITL